MIDVLTDTGAFTGRRKSKPEVHRDGDWHRAAHLWLATANGMVLLQRRAHRKENHGGLWDVSAAGHLSAGEDAASAIVRETREELGLEIRPEELHFEGTTREENLLNDGTYIDREFHAIFLVIRPVIDVRTLLLQEEEVEGVELISVEHLAQRVRANDPTLVPHPAEYSLMLRRLR